MVLAQTSSSLSNLKPGLHFHQYRLLEEIGVGGQGVVWSAFDQGRSEIVAIKFNQIYDSDRDLAEVMTFEHELESLLKLEHPHVLPTYDHGLEDQVHYLVSPYVTGGSLFERIKAGPVHLGESLRYAAEAASALDYLHSQGIMHRDLKASNILLDFSQHSYLSDFGLARTVTATTQALHTGRGTPPYSPPEQHKLAEITPKSDIYSFGILLYELFTGQLPWDGERVLGIQQLYTQVELPDPCEINPQLPPLLSQVLRRVTAANPDLRPRSADEVMRALYYVFKLKDLKLPQESSLDQAATREREADKLLGQNLAGWQLEGGKSELGLTKFALLDLAQKKKSTETPTELKRFMLFHALYFGYDEAYWWSQVTDSGERLRISSVLLGLQDEAITARVLAYLVGDQSFRARPAGLPGEITTSLLEMAARTDDPLLREQLVAGLLVLIPPPDNWNDTSLDPDQTKLLAKLALEDSDFGDQAARLIGRLRSQPALKLLLEMADESRLITALLEIRQTAGSLPVAVGKSLRRRVLLEWTVRRVIAQPVHLFGAYMLALLGSALGVAFQVYLTYRLPEFMDVVRISSALEQGLIIGSIFGFGILTARLMVERFPGPRAWLRLLFGTIAGAAGMNIALLVFHVIFINTPPTGFLITAGCILIALSYALGGLTRRRLLKILLSVSAVFAAIVGTWQIHKILANSLTNMTPLFHYDNGWPMTQVALTALAVALMLGIFGNLVRLDLPEE
jgi:serine/threonine protein kinase